LKILTCVLAFTSLLTIALDAQSGAELPLHSTIQLPAVKGKFDHFAFDERGNRLFVAASSNGSVEVIDLATGKTIQSLTGLGKPHGLAWIPETGHLFVADGGKAELEVFSGSPLRQEKTIALSEDADDMVYDPATKLLYVGHGGTNAANPPAVAVIDTQRLAVADNLPVTSHPEGLEIDAKGDRVFANIADSGEIAVIDGKTHQILQHWTLKNVKGNTPLAYDAQDNLLLIGCRTPSELLVLDEKTGKQVAMASSAPGVDDLFYDSAARRVYAIAGSGAIDSFSLGPDGALQSLAVTHTPTGSKTGLFIPTRGFLYVGVPGTTGPATIRVYQPDTK